MCDFAAINTQKLGKTMENPKFKNVVTHSTGFTEEYMKQTFKAAGVAEDFRMGHATTVDMEGHEVDIFVATGHRSR